MLNNRSSDFKKTKPKLYLKHSTRDKIRFATSVFMLRFESQLQKKIVTLAEETKDSELELSPPLFLNKHQTFLK